MKIVRRLPLVLLSGIFLLPAVGSAQDPAASVDPAAKKLVDDYLAAIKGVKDATYTLEKVERMRTGKKFKETLAIRLRVAPYAVYMIRRKPSAGMEAIFRAGKNEGQMRVHPGSFPDITLNLDPEGSMAMKNQHFPIYQTGMADATKRMIKALELAAKGKLTIKMIDAQEVGGKKYPCVEIDATKTGGWKTKAKEEETVFDVARRTKSAPYLLYRYNRVVDDIDDELDGGVDLFVPAYYAKRTHYCFDTATKLFVRETYFDANGLWERYDTIGRQINTGLTNRDFDPDNPKYDF